MANDLPIIQYHIIKNDFCRNKQCYLTNISIEVF